MRKIVVTGGFDDVRSPQLRFLEEAARLGDVSVLLWPDEAIAKFSGKPPKFPLAERQYFLNAVRYVNEVLIGDQELAPDRLPASVQADAWVMEDDQLMGARRDFCRAVNMECRVLAPASLTGFPEPPPIPHHRDKKVIVTGCYDWFHSGHVRFFEEVSALGDLYVAVGNDANVRNLKGDGHPLFSQEERRYVAGSIRYVTQAMFTTGWGWLDAEPEILRIKPDMYAVNEDGDKPEKREYCDKHGIQYVILKRTPAPGLTRRSSTDLRGF